MNKIKELCVKYKDILLYGFFGACTTVVSFVTYFLLSELSLFPKSINTVVNTSISWLCAVLFAYVTNRKWVFESKATTKNEIINELGAFFACRIATGVLEVVIMYLCVDKLSFNDLIVKLAATIIVIVINYVASKLYIFKSKNEDTEEIAK